MGSQDISNSELLVILFVCVFGIAPLFILMFAFIFPEQLCTRDRRRQMALDRWREQAGLLHPSDGESGYAADDEASPTTSVNYSSPPLTNSQSTSEGSSNSGAGLQPLRFTITWHPTLGWHIRPSKRPSDCFW